MISTDRGSFFIIHPVKQILCFLNINGNDLISFHQKNKAYQNAVKSGLSCFNIQASEVKDPLVNPLQHRRHFKKCILNLRCCLKAPHTT